jgi:hypothetical protein
MLYQMTQMAGDVKCSGPPRDDLRCVKSWPVLEYVGTGLQGRSL